MSPLPSPEDACWPAIQWAWARLLIDSFARSGVRDVVISPGSRSTPFVLAADRHPELHCRDILDERAAGFFALGQAKASGDPSLLISTSGTAGAHYLPAVMEASLSHTPLLILTADRPFELHGCGANQTVDQLHLFGAHVRRFVHLGRPDSMERALRALRRTAVQAVATSRAPIPGPVHLNAPARKPLEPEAAETGEEAVGPDEAVWGPDEEARARELEERYERLRAAPQTRVAETPPLPDAPAVQEVAEAIAASERPLLVCGPAPLAARRAASDLYRLAALARVPLAAEATSQLRFGTGDLEPAPRFAFFDTVYRSPRARERLAPDLILQVGGAPASAGLLALASDLAAAEQARRIVVAEHGWPDPESAADLLLRAGPGSFARAVAGALQSGTKAAAEAGREAAQEAWVAALEEADRKACAAIENELASAGEALTEGAVAREVPSAVPHEGLLALGNSLPVRQVDAWCPPGVGPAQVLSQRGVSGIDGLVSGTAGAAGRSGRPTALLVGDVSFLHDLNGLLAARDLAVPFAVVVVNNDGGRIFEELPIAKRPELAGALSHFTTPHGASIEHASAVYGHRYKRADTVSGLREALGRAISSAGCTVIEARVPAHGATEQNARVRRAVDEALQVT